ncbi:elongation factor-like GTPase 1 [Bolinopsis microptera]|uniref:elongation factor-like GTPase 1 n=1 Tax=Bolinopsis microptera TaxID=2820187 RepID=UPI0030795113
MEGRLKMLQENTKNIRNLCILAHVDHGKTTIADSLIASNGIISQRLAGKLRYLDNLNQEKARGITMKSSAISLHHRNSGEDYLLNLIDSPGHVDFSGEVSTAVRLCDGAYIVVDVVEGVCPQTVTVLQQAWAECIKPCLILNKCDRLITEMKFSPDEAYVHLQRLLEQINSKVGELHSSSVMKKEHQEYMKSRLPTEAEPESDSVYDWSSGLDLDENDDSNIYFSPELGNVAFASASDGWAFRISTFATQYQRKMGIKRSVLMKTLWGDYYLNNKAKQISKGAYAKGKRPLFVTFILDSIWNVYRAVLLQRNKERIDQIVTSLKLKIAPRDARSTDYRVQLFAVCSAWMPMAATVLDMACEVLPAPNELTSEKIQNLLCSGVTSIEQLPPETQDLKTAFRNCSGDDNDPVIVYVSKMFSVLPGAISTNKHRPLTDDEIERRRDAARIRNQQKLTVNFNPETIELGPRRDTVEEEKEPDKEQFIAFCRIYSGRIEPGKQVFVLGPRHDPRTIAAQERSTMGVNVHVGKVALGACYLLMGGDLEVVPSVAAGNICGIGGLKDLIQKSATISDSLFCPPFHGMSHWQTPVLRVAVEPTNPAEIPALIMGMKLLNQSDPCVETTVLDTGELVLCTSGEVHLDRCIEDLKTRFSKIDIKVSPPLVSFRETIVIPPKLDKVNEAIIEEMSDSSNSKAHTIQTANKSISFTVQAFPLSEEFVNFISENRNALKCLVNSTLFAGSTNHTPAPIDEHTDFKIEEFKLFLEEHLEDIPVENCIEKIICFGPSQIGPNILINNIPRYDRPVIWPGSDSENLDMSCLWDYESSVIRGFDLAVSSGPLCEEPMAATLFVLQEWIGSWQSDTTESVGQPIAGQIVSAVKEGCRQAFLKKPCRLMIAMYKCEVQATAEVLGRVYGVLAKRQGRVISEELKEGSGTFVIAAVLPVAESLGFADEIRKKTSGFAMPQLVFSHWETLQEDPFWVPTTEEELAHFGELGDSGNLAHDYMMSARKRKGLSTDEQIVVSGEKQRTLKKNK